MARVRAAIAATAAVLGLATPALAAGDSRAHGECSVNAVQSDALGAEWRGTLSAAVAVHSPSGEPAGATVTCSVLVNDIPVAAVSADGTGLVVVAGPVTYRADVADLVDICTTVDFTSDATPTATTCGPPSGLPNPVTYDPNPVEAVLDLADQVVCGQTGGDLYVAGELWWDCPPYQGT